MKRMQRNKGFTQHHSGEAGFTQHHSGEAGFTQHHSGEAGFTQHHSNGAGFTLIELLVVIGIIALIVGATLPNLLSARQRARDAVRKENLQQMKKALRLYYNDYNIYPGDSSPTYVSLKGCGTNHVTACSALTACSCAISSGCVSAAFATGDLCDNIYMKQFPAEFQTGGGTKTIQYFQIASGDDFLLKVGLENASDPDAAASRARCPGVSGKTCGSGDYCVCAD